jgi:hypothetical protein
MSAPGHEMQLVEVFEQGIGPPGFNGLSQSPSLSNGSLRVILVEAPEDPAQVGAQIYRVETEDGCRLEACNVNRHLVRSELDVPTVASNPRFQRLQERTQRVRCFQKRLTMIRERQRDEAGAGQPAVDATEEQAVP